MQANLSKAFRKASGLDLRFRETSGSEKSLWLGKGANQYGYCQKTKRRIGRQAYCSFQEIVPFLCFTKGSTRSISIKTPGGKKKKKKIPRPPQDRAREKEKLLN